MPYLLAQILIFLVLAMLFGGVCGYLWFRQSFEDVTESYSQSQQQYILSSSGAGDLKPLVSGFRQISLRIDEFAQQVLDKYSDSQVNLNPLLSKLSTLSGELADMHHNLSEKLPELNTVKTAKLIDNSFDLSTLEARFQKLQERIEYIPHETALALGPLKAILLDLEGRLDRLPPATTLDLSPLESRFQLFDEQLTRAIQAGSPHKVRFQQFEEQLTLLADTTAASLSPLNDRFEQLEKQLNRVATIDLSRLEDRFEQLERQLNRTTSVDLSPLEDRFQQLERQLNRTSVDLSPLEHRFEQLEKQLSRTPSVDLSPLDDRFQQLGRQLSRATTIDLSPLEDHFQRLKEQFTHAPPATSAALNSLDNRLQQIVDRLSYLPRETAIDLHPLEKQLHQLEEQLTLIPRTSQPDLGPLELRLKQLEEQLTQVSHAATANISPLKIQIQQIEDRLIYPPPSSIVDLSPIEARMASLESTLPTFREQLTDIEIKLVEVGNANILDSSTDWQKLDPAVAIPNGPPESFELVRRSDGSKNLLKHPAYGLPDDFRLMSGIGPVLESSLRNIGVYYFWQMADWTREDIAFIDARLTPFRGRIQRGNWVVQARVLQQHGRPRPDDVPQSLFF
ncbi:MAG: hypothetical protein KTR25_11925 [Myxococcales bacterium]|nr:hypothetical protein [Myxococcales bacterium]